MSSSFYQCANSYAYSTNSIDGILNGEDDNMSEEAWKAELSKRIEQISNTKRSSTEGRTESYSVYAHILMARYARKEIEIHLSELVSSLIKSIRQETTDREVIAALKGRKDVTLLQDSADTL
jgi:predicted restriction endonuclease